MKHTPGSWGRNIAPASKYPIIYAGRNTHVARVLSEGLSLEEIEGNANLIAAAPDLLAALEELRFRADKHGMNTDEANRAIAKATGQS